MIQPVDERTGGDAEEKCRKERAADAIRCCGGCCFTAVEITEGTLAMRRHMPLLRTSARRAAEIMSDLPTK
jgi:hypothetical protein